MKPEAISTKALIGVPVLESCQQALLKGEHACFGISPFNSYFNEARLMKLALWGRENFRSIHFFIPDKPSAFTLEALGYEPEKAEWKARRQSQYLKNKLSRALRGCSYSDEEIVGMILDWDTLLENPEYWSLYQRAGRLFQEDDIFRRECLDASRWVLEKRIYDESELTTEVLTSAARYLLAEIPLFADTARITGQSSSVFCYHQCPAFIENLLRGRYPYPIGQGQGFVVIQEPSQERCQSS
jgi:cyclo(L-tyrosyl-L-tyrosyl) synthase